MIVLGFDTATTACSAALWRDGRILAHRFEAMKRGQAEHLMGMIGSVIEEAGTAYQDLDLLAVTTGPGAFTGLRIGLAAARGMALAGDLACLGVTTLEAVAAGVPKTERDGATLLVALDSKRDDLYVQAFTAGLEPLSAAQAVLPSALAAVLDRSSIKGRPVLVAGDAGGRAVESLNAAGLEAVLSDAPGTPDAGIVAALAASRWSPETPPGRPRPLYLRPPDAKAPKNGGRLRP